MRTTAIPGGSFTGRRMTLIARERIERRLLQLEPAVRILRRQFADFTQDKDETLPEETKIAKEPPS